LTSITVRETPVRTTVAPRPSAQNSEDPASRAQHEKEDAERIAAQQEQQLKQQALQAAGNFMQELYENAKVVDNRYLFF
jgi:transcription elongation GreA/GreB family factor